MSGTCYLQIIKKGLTHKQRVWRLYKMAYRDLESTENVRRHEFFHNRVLLRERFDRNMDIKDMRKAALILEAGEDELWKNQTLTPYFFVDSPGGTRHMRNPPQPEWKLDEWPPEDKAPYPEYFAKRTERLLEYKQYLTGKLEEWAEQDKEFAKNYPELYEEYSYIYNPKKRYIDDHYPELQAEIPS